MPTNQTSLRSHSRLLHGTHQAHISTNATVIASAGHTAAAGVAVLGFGEGGAVGGGVGVEDSASALLGARPNTALAACTKRRPLRHKALVGQGWGWGGENGVFG